MNFNDNFNKIFNKIYSLIEISIYFILGFLSGLLLFGIYPSLEATFYTLRQEDNIKDKEVLINYKKVFTKYYKDNFIRSNKLMLHSITPIAITYLLIFQLENKRIKGILINPLMLILVYLLIVFIVTPFIASFLDKGIGDIFRLSLVYPFVEYKVSIFIIGILLIFYFISPLINPLLLLLFLIGLIIKVLFKLLLKSIVKYKS